MENDEFKKVCIKNCMCYYFHDIVKLEDFDIGKILINEKWHIRIYHGTRYLTFLFLKNMMLFTTELDGYHVSLKSSITYIFSYYFAKINVGSYDPFLIEKLLTLHNVIILIKSVLNRDKNHYYCKIFLEKCSYHLAKKIITKILFMV